MQLDTIGSTVPWLRGEIIYLKNKLDKAREPFSRCVKSKGEIQQNKIKVKDNKIIASV